MERFVAKTIPFSTEFTLHKLFKQRKFTNCLNIGSPTTLFNRVLKTYTNQITTIDIDPEEKNVKKMNALNLKLNQQYDLIFSNQVIEHIDQKNHLKYFDQCIKNCTFGGCIVTLTPNQYAPTRYLELTHGKKIDPDHKKEFDIQYAKKLAKQIQKKHCVAIKIFGYSSQLSSKGHPRINKLWNLVPFQIGYLITDFIFTRPRLARGLVIVIQNEGRRYWTN